MIYNGDAWPEKYYGSIFTGDVSANLVRRETLEPNGVTFLAKPATEGKEFLASTDERFRPVNLTTAPDGALIVTDFYRGIIQHRISLTTYLREQIVKRGLEGLQEVRNPGLRALLDVSGFPADPPRRPESSPCTSRA